MAFPTSVNDQVTDSITQANTQVLGDAPSVATGNLFVASSQALSNAAHNAAFNQMQTNLSSQTSNTQCISTLYSVDTASTGKATQRIFA